MQPAPMSMSASHAAYSDAQLLIMHGSQPISLLGSPFIHVIEHDPGIGCPPPPSPPASPAPLLLPLEPPELSPLEPLPLELPELPPLELPELLLLVPPSGTHACAAFWVHVA